MERMTAEFIQDGNSLNYENKTGASIAAGDVITLATRCGVAAAGIPVGAVGVVTVTGVFEVPAESTAAFVMGEPVCWDANAKQAVKKADGKPALGWAAVEKKAGAAFCYVKLEG